MQGCYNDKTLYLESEQMKNNTGEEANYNYDFFETTSVTDFVLKDYGKAPKGYPLKSVPDSYSDRPFQSNYDKRKKALLGHLIKNPAQENIKGYYVELARLYVNRGPVYRGALYSALDFINKRCDCADFVMLGIIRILYQFRESKLLDKKLIHSAEKALLDFKYWPDEPGIDSMCTWTENHQVMFSVNEYLAGQLFPDSVFTNSGMTGYEKMCAARSRLLTWLRLRYQTGFSEWLSHIYYDEDITALVNLVDFCSDPVIVRQGEIVLDLIFLDMALNSYKGVFGSTHGRSYAAEKRNGLVESTTDTEKLLFGMGTFSGIDNMSAVTLAISPRYRLPSVIAHIADHRKEDSMENRQRMSFKLKDAKKWGLDRKDLDDAMTLLTMEAYVHPRTIQSVMKLFDRFRWWENNFFSMFKSKKVLIQVLRYTGLLPLLAKVMEKDFTRNTREEVNTYTYRTPDYMLSAAVDYRKGYGGDQQHIWQATLSPEAVVFTTHPGHRENTSGGYWVGSGTLPRVAQYKNILVACYRASRMPGIYMTNELFFTHAWFPADKFDEVVEKGGWVFGRKDKGYVALYSATGYRWQKEGEDAGKELIATGRKNTWICECGSEKENGPFSSFVDAISSSRLRIAGSRMIYESPASGAISFGWKGAFKVNNSRVMLKDNPRYDNQYCRTPFPPREITVNKGKHHLVLDLEKGIRKISSYI